MAVQDRNSMLYPVCSGFLFHEFRIYIMKGQGMVYGVLEEMCWRSESGDHVLFWQWIPFGFKPESDILVQCPALPQLLNFYIHTTDCNRFSFI